MYAPRLLLAAGAGCLLAAAGVLASDPVVLERGAAKLSLVDIDARMSRFPDHERASYVRDPENVARMLDQMLVNRELALQARELGLDQEPAIKRDIELAVDEILAIHRLNRLISLESLPDFEPLAREKYQADPSQYQIPEARAVQHLLVSTRQRSEDEALELARDIRRKALAADADFAGLVEEFSEDPGKTTNQGRYTLTQSGEFVPEFEAAARRLENPGDISEPVKTTFGYHLILLTSLTPATQRSFDDVKAGIIRLLRDEHVKQKRGQYVAEIKAIPETGDLELLRTLPARYGGRPEEQQAVSDATEQP